MSPRNYRETENKNSILPPNCFWAILEDVSLNFLVLPEQLINSLKFRDYNLLKHSLFDFMHPEDAHKARADMRNALVFKSLKSTQFKFKHPSFNQPNINTNLRRFSALTESIAQNPLNINDRKRSLPHPFYSPRSFIKLHDNVSIQDKRVSEIKQDESILPPINSSRNKNIPSHSPKNVLNTPKPSNKYLNMINETEPGLKNHTNDTENKTSNIYNNQHNESTSDNYFADCSENYSVTYLTFYMFSENLILLLLHTSSPEDSKLCTCQTTTFSQTDLANIRSEIAYIRSPSMTRNIFNQSAYSPTAGQNALKTRHLQVYKKDSNLSFLSACPKDNFEKMFSCDLELLLSNNVGFNDLFELKSSLDFFNLGLGTTQSTLLNIAVNDINNGIRSFSFSLTFDLNDQNYQTSQKGISIDAIAFSWGDCICICMQANDSLTENSNSKTKYEYPLSHKRKSVDSAFYTHNEKDDMFVRDEGISFSPQPAKKLNSTRAQSYTDINQTLIKDNNVIEHTPHKIYGQNTRINYTTESSHNDYHKNAGNLKGSDNELRNHNIIQDTNKSDNYVRGVGFNDRSVSESANNRVEKPDYKIQIEYSNEFKAPNHGTLPSHNYTHDGFDALSNRRFSTYNLPLNHINLERRFSQPVNSIQANPNKQRANARENRFEGQSAIPYGYSTNITVGSNVFRPNNNENGGYGQTNFSGGDNSRTINNYDYTNREKEIQSVENRSGVKMFLGQARHSIPGMTSMNQYSGFGCYTNNTPEIIYKENENRFKVKSEGGFDLMQKTEESARNINKGYLEYGNINYRSSGNGTDIAMPLEGDRMIGENGSSSKRGLMNITMHQNRHNYETKSIHLSAGTPTFVIGRNSNIIDNGQKYGFGYGYEYNTRMNAGRLSHIGSGFLQKGDPIEGERFGPVVRQSEMPLQIHMQIQSPMGMKLPLQQKGANSCQSCGTFKSPEWRRGPNGHKTLCNACGLRYSRALKKEKKKVDKQLIDQ
ncbi:hypothetical protein BB558_004014 [Smittium angustum]|uniref:GATA-type domain-containing protein n=1 Tax=Smittium angustum TaxID=133377 RepID=A0A2U1J4H1_SMIAN|nr:hypothetical protein BB558_004014 [Smittium angustum]